VGDGDANNWNDDDNRKRARKSTDCDVNGRCHVTQHQLPHLALAQTLQRGSYNATKSYNKKAMQQSVLKDSPSNAALSPSANISVVPELLCHRCT
jgi:hypothetical protein